jgi:predicted XRE-type DNA-binding protein
MSRDFDDPKAWLKDIDKGIVNAPHTHPGDPNFATRVKELTEQLRHEHHIVASLAELRKQGAALTQNEVAQRWGRVQSRVSSLEADISKIEVATLMDYVRALHGTLEVRITVDNHTYIEQLV